jgi:hypothetical protein
VIRPLPRAIEEVLEAGSLCYLTAPTASGPHLTPLVYAIHDSRLWVTTTRRSVKARAWRRDPRVGALVRAGARSLVLSGTVRTHDLLRPGTWLESLRSSPQLTLAAGAFARRNARFFAGYAVDAHRVPLAWTPPGRVFTEVRIESAALVSDGVERVWGELPEEIHSKASFPVPAGRGRPLTGVPEDVLERVGTSGPAALAVDVRDRTVVLPARWALAAGGLYAVLDETTLALAGAARPELTVGLAVDHASSWRARAMAGVTVRGTGIVHVLARLRSGRERAREIALAAGVTSDRCAIVTVEPLRVVWWSGWTSGTVRP